MSNIRQAVKICLNDISGNFYCYIKIKDDDIIIIGSYPKVSMFLSLGLMGYISKPYVIIKHDNNSHDALREILEEISYHDVGYCILTM